AVRRAAARDPRVGGHRAGRSAGAPSGGGDAAGGALYRHAGGVLPAGRGDDLPGDGAEIELGRLGVRTRAPGCTTDAGGAGAAPPAERADAAHAKHGPRPRLRVRPRLSRPLLRPAAPAGATARPAVLFAGRAGV